MSQTKIVRLRFEFLVKVTQTRGSRVAEQIGVLERRTVLLNGQIPQVTSTSGY
ncbi:hypothetical protein OLMES_3234 [Oleiphilus messinensis]|uniref:Uncharacterized protein n=1 Tax=Oleiphilus messinensis TaxID=141451 RepID=A0A1Y0ICS7_9GAMM|nr:hypothetical protein OLMES_3234 [Oleiphilus messinensis]